MSYLSEWAQSINNAKKLREARNINVTTKTQHLQELSFQSVPKGVADVYSSNAFTSVDIKDSTEQRQNIITGWNTGRGRVSVFGKYLKDHSMNVKDWYASQLGTLLDNKLTTDDVEKISRNANDIEEALKGFDKTGTSDAFTKAKTRSQIRDMLKSYNALKATGNLNFRLMNYAGRTSEGRNWDLLAKYVTAFQSANIPKTFTATLRQGSGSLKARKNTVDTILQRSTIRKSEASNAHKAQFIQATGGEGHVQQVTYDCTTGIMEVVFRDTGTQGNVVVYFGIPNSIAFRICDAINKNTLTENGKHLAGELVWDLMRLRTTVTGTRYAFEYPGMQVSFSGDVAGTDNAPNAQNGLMRDAAEIATERTTEVRVLDDSSLKDFGENYDNSSTAAWEGHLSFRRTVNGFASEELFLEEVKDGLDELSSALDFGDPTESIISQLNTEFTNNSSISFAQFMKDCGWKNYE